MAFLKLKEPNPVNRLGECIASFYHASQSPCREQFQRACINAINNITPLSRFSWKIDAQQNYIHLSKNKWFAIFEGEGKINIEFVVNDLSTIVPILSEDTELISSNKIFHKKIISCHGARHYFDIEQVCENDILSKNEQTELTMFLPHLAEAFRLHILSQFQKAWKCDGYLGAIIESSGHEIYMERIFDEKIKQAELSKKELFKMRGFLSQKSFFLYKDLLFGIEKILDVYFIRMLVFNGVLSNLTLKEKQVCFYVNAAFSNTDISKALKISEKTVENHLSNIYQKINIDSRAKLVSSLYSAIKE